MPSPTHRDPAHIGDYYDLVSFLDLMTDNLVTNMWNFVTDNNGASRSTKLTAKVAELSYQLTEISLRINDIETKIDRERTLKFHIRQICEDFTDRRRHLMNWLRCPERDDELEDACLAGDSELAILVDMETNSVLRWYQSLACDELLYRLRLVDSTERLKTYVRQYAKIVFKLMVLNNTIASFGLATLKNQY